MEGIIIEIINKYGYIGICLLIAIENIFPPIPSEIILTFGGFLTTFSDMGIWGVIIAATVGSLLGAIILYSVSCILNIERLEGLFESKLGKMLRLKKEDVKKAEEWFSKHGTKAVLLCRFVPIVRSLISIPAGIAKMKLSIFLPLTIVGTLIWNIVLVYLGRFAGDTWGIVASYFDFYSMIALAFFGLVVLIIAALFIKKRFFEQNTNEE